MGSNEIPFDAHIELLCDCSPYFDRVFHARFVKTISEPVRFPDDDPDIFAEFISWAYSEEVFNDQPVTKMIHTFQLWVLAAKLEVPELQDTAIMLMEEKLDERPSAIVGDEVVNYVYNNTTLNSHLRRVVVDIWIVNGTKQRFLFYKCKLPRPFLEDLCYAWLEKVETSNIPRFLCDSEAHSFVQPPTIGEQASQGVPIARSSDVPDKPQLATADQMANRRMRIPSSRLRNHSSVSPSQGTATPASPITNVDKKCEVSQEMENLNI